MKWLLLAVFVGSLAWTGWQRGWFGNIACAVDSAVDEAKDRFGIVEADGVRVESEAISVTEAPTFFQVLYDESLSHEQRVKKLQGLDPGALQHRVVDLSTQGDPKRSAPSAALEKGSKQSPSVDDAREDVKITMYSTSWCGACKAARAYLNLKKIPYEELDVDNDEQARAEYLRINPGRGVPTIRIDDEVMVGFGASAFEAARERAVNARMGI